MLGAPKMAGYGGKGPGPPPSIESHTLAGPQNDHGVVTLAGPQNDHGVVTLAGLQNDLLACFFVSSPGVT